MVLLTGASGGLGRALAQLLISRGRRVIMPARRDQVLAELAGELGPGAIPIAFDLSEQRVAERLAEALRARDINPSDIDLLVNNAGLGAAGAFDATPIEHLRRMQRLNVGVPMELMHWLVPLMEAAGGGAICNIASVAAFSAGPFMAEYYADKAWMLSIGRSLRSELRSRGISITTVCPGPFQSEFHTRAGLDSARVGARLTAERVANVTLDAIESGRAVRAVGAGAHVWALLGPRLPGAWSAALMGALQRRRLEGDRPDRLH
jgi:short-subunit dehydrogenase